MQSYYWVWFACLSAMAIIISYADRTNMAITILPISKEQNWSERTSGMVLGAFFVGYSLTQVFGGWLSDRRDHGGVVLLCGVVTWSMVTILTPVTIRTCGSTGAILIRIVLGMAEGVGFPACHSMLPARCPSTGLLTLMVSVVNASSFVGGVLALVVSAPVASGYGWPMVFYGFGVVGLIWAIPWSIYLVCGDERVRHRDVVSVDCASVDSNAPASVDSNACATSPLSPTMRRRKQAASPAPTPPPPKWTIRKMVQSSAFLAMFTCYYCNSWGFWMITTWLPTFLQQRYQVSLKDLGFASVIPYGLQGIFSLSAGCLFDRLVKNKRVGRLSIQAVAMFVPALCLLFLVLGPSVNKAGALVVLSLAMSMNALSTAGVGMNHMDLVPDQAGLVYGWLNMVGVVPGAIAVPLTGVVLEGVGEERGWLVVFVVASIHYVAGWVVWWRFGVFHRVQL